MPEVVVITGASAGVGRATVQAFAERNLGVRMGVVGGGAVGLEMGQTLSCFGSRVTLVQHADRLLNREDGEVGELIRAAFAEEGIEVLTGRSFFPPRPPPLGAAK